MADHVCHVDRSGDISYYLLGRGQAETEPARDFSTPVEMTGVRSPKRLLITLFYPENVRFDCEIPPSGRDDSASRSGGGLR